MRRSYLIPVYSNPGKQESIRYTATRFIQFVQHFVNKFFYDKISKSSTKGMGKLANQAQRRATQIIRAQRAASEATGNKSSCPEIKFKSYPAKIEVSEDSSYARVFVEKEEPKLIQSKGFLGVDVGINHTVARSDGYLGPSAREILNRSKEKRAEQSRQIALKEITEIKANLKKDGLETRNFTLSKAKTAKHSALKQQLGIDVSRALNVSKRNSLSLVVENPKSLSNLNTKNLLAKCYFASRATIRAREEGIRVIYVNPAYSSQTCSKCGTIDKRSRVKQAFRCTACGFVAHADLNAACILAQRASVMQHKGA